MIPVIPPGSTRSMQINVQAPDSDVTVLNIASVDSNEIDPVPGNNTDTETTDVGRDADVIMISGFEGPP